MTTNTGQRLASVQQLMELFKLSPAEARFARALAHGESIDDYANHEGLKRSTVKSHLLSALAKTGTKSQKDIVRLVVTLAAVRGRGFFIARLLCRKERLSQSEAWDSFP